MTDNARHCASAWLDPASCARSDAMLMEILQERKSLTGFLDAVFGFLRRNTDFYHIKTDPAEKIGFAKGVREQLLFGALQQYDPECHTNLLVSQDDEVPPAVAEETVVIEEIVEDTEQPMKTPSKEPRALFAPSDYKNGALFSEYCWSQTLKELELHVALPPDVRSAKHLALEIQPDSIRVSSKLEPCAVIIAGQLHNRVKHKEPVWTIADGKLLISLDKAREGWWDKLFITENAINTNKIDCERYIDELPEDSQAVIQRLRLEQMEQDAKDHRAADSSGVDVNGSDNENMERVRRAWDAEGSPFRGQPFNPSLIKFS